jgi:acyl-CoA thioesterase II
MDARTFFGLVREPGESTRWTMEVIRALTSGTGALFGGCGLGACIEVMEELTGRPCIWATAQ